MKACRWLKTLAIAEIEFAEWTPDELPRHGSFIGLRRDKKSRDVVKET